MADQTVVITGASSGIGRATVRRFAAPGVNIGLVARGRDGLKAARDEVERAGGRALMLPSDVADAEAVDAAAQAVEEALGPIDIWINDAMATVFAFLWDVSADEFRRANEVTYFGSIWGMQAALKRMRPRKLEMTLARIAPYSVVEYTSVQRGLPDARHERHFADADGDLAYRIIVSYQPRPGWRSAFDRLLVRRGIARAARKTLANLDRRFSQAGAERQ